MYTGSADGFLVVLLTFNALLALAAATVLLTSLPGYVKLYLRETGRWLNCWAGLLLLVGIILLPINLLLGFVHCWLIPLPMAAEAVMALVTQITDMDGMHAAMEEIRDKHQYWYTHAGGTSDAARKVESLLWVTWPLIAGMAAVLLFVGLRAFKRFYSRLAKDLETHSMSMQFDRLFDEHVQRASPRHRRHRHHRHHRHHRGHTATE